MRLLGGFPPNYADIAAAFDLSGKRPIFCYGNAIYNPHGIRIDAPLLAHETRHSQQQAETSPCSWWGRYLAEPQFRLSQEVDAYRTQIAVFAQKCGDRERRLRFAMELAGHLASPMYGSLLTRQDALSLLRKPS